MSQTQRKRIEVLETALLMAHRQLDFLQCIQGCAGGAIQISEDDFEQCQCCAERDLIRDTLGLEKNSIDLINNPASLEDDDLPF